MTKKGPFSHENDLLRIKFHQNFQINLTLWVKHCICESWKQVHKLWHLLKFKVHKNVKFLF